MEDLKNDVKKEKLKKLCFQIPVVMLGLTLYALGLALFVLPVDMIAAGTAGIALIGEHFLGIPMTTFVSIFCISMFLLGWLEFGKEFALSTLIASFYYPFILDKLVEIIGDRTLTDDPMLCAIFSGMMIGCALGIVMRAGASTGGTDIPPLVLKKRLGIPISVTLYVIDFVVLTVQMTFGDPERILYALVMVMVYTMVLDKVLMMGARQTQVKIISTKFEEINTAIQTEMDRGSTLLYMEGGHERRESRAILLVISGRELPKLNELVMKIDSQAFMIVNQVGEVRGRGFTLKKEYH